MRTTLKLIAINLGIMVMAGLSAGEARAATEATKWVEGYNTQVRLVNGGRQLHRGRTQMLAGVHMRLGEGWHTYWRSPGDSGFPPTFDWSGSDNVRISEVQWPAPRRITYVDGNSIGYLREVVFPVVLVPENSTRPMVVRLKIDYAVCKDICVPAHAELTLRIAPAAMSSSAPASSNIVSRYLAQVPAPATGPQAEGPLLGTVKAQLDGERPHILVETLFPKGADGADLFVEAPDDYYVPLPQRLPGGDNGRVLFRVDLSRGGDFDKLKGRALRLTIVCAKGQSETSWRVQ